MKKTIVLVLCIAMLLTLIAGCAKTPGDEGTPSGESASSETSAGESATSSEVTDQEITITYQTVSATDMFTKAFAVYQETHPNVKLDVQVAADAQAYNGKVVAQCETKTLPDVTWWNGAQFAGSFGTGAFLDLTDIIDNQFKARFLDGSFLMSTTAEGVKTCFPCEMQIQGFLVNTDLFEQYNLELPETFDELLNCAEVFAANGITLFGNGSGDTWPTWGWYHWFELWGINEQGEDLYGNGSLKFSDSDAKQALYKMIELYDAGAFPANNSTITYDMTKNLFLTGQCASMTTSTDWLTDIVGSDLDKSGAIQYWFGATFPDSTYDQNTCVKMVGNGYGISSSVSEEKLAVILDFFNWFYSNAGANIALADGLTLPCSFAATAEITPLVASILDLTMNTTRTGVITTDYAAYNRWGQNVDIFLESALYLGTMTNGCIDGSITAADLPEYLANYDTYVANAIDAYAALEG